MKRRDIDIRATGLEERAAPLGPDTRDEPLKFSALDESSFDRGWKFGQFAVSEVQVSASAKKATCRKILRRPIEKRPRGGAELGDHWAAVALQPECCGSAGRMETANRFGFDHQHGSARRNLGTETRPGDAAANDQDIDFSHVSAVTVLKAAPSTSQA